MSILTSQDLVFDVHPARSSLMKLSGKEFVKSFNVRICPEDNDDDDDDDDDDNAAIGNGMQCSVCSYGVTCGCGVRTMKRSPRWMFCVSLET